MFSMVAPAYAQSYGVSNEEMRTVLARIASKNHANGARNPRAQFRKEMSVEQLCAMPAVAGGCRCSTARAWPTAPLRRSSSAPRTRSATPTKPLLIKALSFVAGDGLG